LNSPAVEKSTGADEEGIGSLAHKGCKSRVDLTAGAGVEDLDLQSHGASSHFYLSQYGFRSQSKDRIDEHGNTRDSGHQLTQELQPLCH
jgi:hypothetical protein